jgi:hypothetical protein
MEENELELGYLEVRYEALRAVEEPRLKAIRIECGELLGSLLCSCESEGNKDSELLFAHGPTEISSIHFKPSNHNSWHSDSPTLTYYVFERFPLPCTNEGD